MAVRDRAPAEGLSTGARPGPAGPALVLGAATSVQFGAAVAVLLFDRVGPQGAVLLRLALAAVMLLVLWRPSLRGHSPPQWRLVGLFGVALAGMNGCYYAAIDRIPLGIAVTLEFVGPLGVALAGSRRARDLVWVALAAAGIVALAEGTSGGLDELGAGLAVVAGGFWAAYILLSARVGQAFDGGRGLALAMVVGAVVVLPVELAQAGDALLTPAALGLGLAVAVLSSAIPYSLELEALRRIPAAVFGVLMSLEPAVAALAGFLVLGQQLGSPQLAGIALVIAASAGATLSARTGTPVLD